MNAAVATHSGQAATNDQDVRTEAHALRFATFLAPMLGGFALGAGIGVLLWNLI